LRRGSKRKKKVQLAEMEEGKRGQEKRLTK